MNPITMKSRARRVVASLTVAVLVAFAVACADKGLTPTGVRYSGKVALQVTVPAQQSSPTDAMKFLMIAVVAPDEDDDEMVFLGGTWVQFTGGTQNVLVTVDQAACPLIDGACQVFVAAALKADTTAFPAVGDLIPDGFSPFEGASDYFVTQVVLGGPVQAITLSQSRFPITRVADDDALRLGTGEPLTNLSFGVLNRSAPMAGFVPAGGGQPTLFIVGLGHSPSGADEGPTQPFPALGIMSPAKVWQRVIATVAPQFTGNPNSGFNDVTALASNEAYMSSGSGLYKYDGTSISKVSVITDSAFAVASVVTATNQKLVIVGLSGGAVSIGNGTTFTRYNLPGATGRVDGVCITGPNEAFASQLTGGGLFRFDGTTWTSVPSQFTQGKLDLLCPAPGQAFVLANNVASGLLRWNGSTWVTIPTTGLGFGRSPIRWGAVSQNELYAWSDSQNVNRAFYRFNGTSWTEVGRTRVTGLDGRMWAMPGAAYLAGPLARIERAAAGGVTVESYQPSLQAVIVTSPSNAFAVGAGTFLSRWNGTRWFVDPPPSTMHTRRVLSSVWSDGPSKAWAVGNANTILRWDVGAGGSGWIKVSDSLSAAGPFDHYWGVWGAGNEAWIVGENTILRCQVGFVCNTQSTGGGALLGIWGTSATNIFAVGDGGRIMRYNGTAWTGMTSPTTKRLARVSGTGPNDVWAVGDKILLHFNGTQWAEVDIGGETIGFDETLPYIPTSVERLPPQNSGSPYQFQSGYGFFVRTPTEVYVGNDHGEIGRWDGGDGPLINDSRRDRSAVMGMSGTPSGCLLVVTLMTSNPVESNLKRGTGPGACFNAPMGAPTSWP